MYNINAMSQDPIAILTSTRSAGDLQGRPHLWPFIILMLALLAAAVIFFGGRTSEAVPTPTVTETPEREARIYMVSYRFGVFSPTNLRIHAGDTVRFRNDSPLPVRIIAQLQPDQRTPEFDSTGDVQPGSYFSYTFATKDIFSYSNYANSNESGVIIVR